MLNFQFIGNLGSDAEVKEFNGNKAVCFNVAHTERWMQADGAKRESTTWISCIINGDGGKLLPYLKRGAQVFVEGSGSARCYSSPKEKRWVAGLNITVRHIELVGGKMDEVPRELCTREGYVYPTYKAYYVLSDARDASGATASQDGRLIDRDGNEYIVNKDGFLTKCQTQDA